MSACNREFFFWVKRKRKPKFASRFMILDEVLGDEEEQKADHVGPLLQVVLRCKRGNSSIHYNAFLSFVDDNRKVNGNLSFVETMTLSILSDNIRS